MFKNNATAVASFPCCFKGPECDKHIDHSSSQSGRGLREEEGIKEISCREAITKSDLKEGVFLGCIKVCAVRARLRQQSLPNEAT